MLALITSLSSFQKRCHTYFLAEYFLGLICKLETRVITLFKTLSKKQEAYFQPIRTSLLKPFCENS